MRNPRVTVLLVSEEEHVKRHTAAPLALLGNAIRGALIGVVETIPGVSGGTVALVVGIYDDLIASAHHATSAVRRLVTGPDRKASFQEEFRKVQWALLIPVMVGMAIAVFTVAGPMEHLVTTYPEQVRAAFFGMVLASVAVPLKLAGLPLRVLDIFIIVGAAVATFCLLSLPLMRLEPTPLTIVCTAALAVSALVLPGISGSFLLLTFGLYESTMGAVKDRDFGYLGLFALGAVFGLIFIVKALRWLLTHHHRGTMVALAGMMIGALRSLWPWQSQEGQLLGIGDNWLILLVFLALGAALVLTLFVVEGMLAKPSVQQVPDQPVRQETPRRAQY